MPLSAAVARIADRYGRVPRAYQRLFETDNGATVLRDLAQEAGALQTSMHAGDPHLTSFNEGKRALFLHIVQKLRWNERDVLRLAESVAADRVEQEEGLR